MKLDHRTATSQGNEHINEQSYTQAAEQTQEQYNTEAPTQMLPGRDTSISQGIRTTIRRPFT